MSSSEYELGESLSDDSSESEELPPTFPDVESLTSLLCNEWSSVLNMNSVPWKRIIAHLNESHEFAPKKEDIFNALNMCHPDRVKAVIIGQDPYPTRGNAHGFSFSVREGVSIPASLRNVYTELIEEYHLTTRPRNGCLIEWVKEGVLLLNTILTVDVGAAKSHAKIGWEDFTMLVIKHLDENCNCVFMAWGKDAENLCSKYVKHSKVIVSGHPSSQNLSNPFVGCGCFKDANKYLISKGILPIRWTRLIDFDNL